MNVIFSQTNGRTVEGVLLAAGKYHLRVLVPGASDVVELSNQYGLWVLESGEPVQLESFICDSLLDASAFSQDMFAMARTVGSPIE